MCSKFAALEHVQSKVLNITNESSRGEGVGVGSQPRFKMDEDESSSTTFGTLSFFVPEIRG